MRHPVSATGGPTDDSRGRRGSSQWVSGDVSASPYPWMTGMPKCSVRRTAAGGGNAEPPEAMTDTVLKRRSPNPGSAAIRASRTGRL